MIYFFDQSISDLSLLRRTCSLSYLILKDRLLRMLNWLIDVDFYTHVVGTLYSIYATPIA